MATLETLSRRLRVGEELRSVVSTMKGLAAVSIHEYEKAVEALREYTATVEIGLQILFRAHPEAMPTRSTADGCSAVVVVGTDQGLCGPLNREIARYARRWLEDRSLQPGECPVVILGSRMAREAAEVGLAPDSGVPLPGSVETIGSAVDRLVIHIDAWQASEEVARVVLFHARLARRTRWGATMLQLVPLDVDRLSGIAARPWPTHQLPGSPHPRRELLAGLIRQDLFISLYRAIAEAKAAEHGARLAAMQAAEQNIEDRLDGLRRAFHQLRQAKITEELLDVLSGFEALSGGWGAGG